MDEVSESNHYLRLNRCRWLWRHASYKDDSYANYCKSWLSKYREYEDQIRIACEELRSIRKFTLAWDVREVSDDKLSEWTTSRWFMERVFDHFMLNDVIEKPSSIQLSDRDSLLVLDLLENPPPPNP